ncbi:MAG TPA: UDP-N-acetylmuramoyl-L-alanyl-D-glutamate--2,6-diaminopimelate ligase [Burkholderiaceae bacterium]|nr:UDP-N-acetylmuramoyl-L-alanyl-D-glutamate--2,6-diaminopimelate ligase [Burkholderiaceae bacterium]
MTTAAEVCSWLRQVAPQSRELRLDSRFVERGDVFVAVPGARADGRDYLATAAGRGAAAAIVEATGWAGSPTPLSLPVLPCDGLGRLLGEVADRYYGRPSERLLVVGVTGTNGKTSTTFWIARMLSAIGRRCAVVGTLGAGFPDEPLDRTGLTTPDAASLHRVLRHLLDAGAAAVAMEVSSIGIDQGRVDGVAFDVAMFTNLSRDHLDYHGSMAAYRDAKARLFATPTLSSAVFNLDDAEGPALAAAALRRGLQVVGYGVATLDALRARIGADAAPGRAGRISLLAASDVQAASASMRFALVWSGAAWSGAASGSSPQAATVTTPLIGSFNVSNLLGVIGAALCCGVPLETAVAQCAALQAPAGRMQRVAGRDAANDESTGEPLVIVDYAHSPDAIEKAIVALRPLARARAGRLWIVFGAGGDRDAGKRAPMGEVATRLADHVVLTSDNPRSEDPHAIIEQIARGADAARPPARIADRAEAIRHAILQAAAADVVLLAGKGHETVQEIGGRRLPFDDADRAREALAARAAMPTPRGAP